MITNSLSNDVRCQIFEELFACFTVCSQGNGIHKIKAENTHDRLCINNISAAGKIDIPLELTYKLNKVAHILDGTQADFNFGFHIAFLLSKVKLIKSFYLYFTIIGLFVFSKKYWYSFSGI